MAGGAEGLQLGEDEVAQGPDIILPAPNRIACRRRLSPDLTVHIEGHARLPQEFVGHVLR